MPTPSKRTSKASASRSSSEEAAPRTAAARKTATRRSPAKKAAQPAKKAARPAKKAAEPAAEESSRPESKGRLSAARVARGAMEQLTELTGKGPEGVTGVSRSEDGWTVEVEVVESHRIPDSTDILATYEVQVDQEGELTGYHRVRRYTRGRTGDE